MRGVYGRVILSLALVIGGAPAAVRAQECGLVELGTLGRSWSRAQNVSPTGAVVGGSPRDGDAFPSPFVWRDGSMRALPAPSSGAATGVDSSGRRIVGETPDGAALWVDGVFSQLPSPNAGWATAAAINDQGVIVGATGPNLAGALATIWMDGRATVLGALEGDVFSRAWGVNARGEVVGISRDVDRRARAFVYRGGKMHPLAVPPGFSSAQAAAINDVGLVAGTATRDTLEDQRAVIWHPDGHPQVLGTLGGSISRATGRRAVNNRGDVVGESTTANGALHGFLWRDAKMIDLNALLPPGTPAEITRAQAITDNGLIAAIARINDTERAVRLSCS